MNHDYRNDDHGAGAEQYDAPAIMPAPPPGEFTTGQLQQATKLLRAMHAANPGITDRECAERLQRDLPGNGLEAKTAYLIAATFREMNRQ